MQWRLGSVRCPWLVIRCAAQRLRIDGDRRLDLPSPARVVDRRFYQPVTGSLAGSGRLWLGHPRVSEPVEQSTFGEPGRPATVIVTAGVIGRVSRADAWLRGLHRTIRWVLTTWLTSPRSRPPRPQCHISDKAFDSAVQLRRHAERGIGRDLAEQLPSDGVRDCLAEFPAES